LIAELEELKESQVFTETLASILGGKSHPFAELCYLIIACLDIA